MLGRAALTFPFWLRADKISLRPMPILRPGLILACVACAAAGSQSVAADPPAGAKFRPQVAPHFTAGEVFGYSATAEYASAMRVIIETRKPQTNGPDEHSGGVALDDRDQFSIQFVAESALAREVFKNGSLREAEFLVSRLRVVDASGQPHDLVKPGTIIGARKQQTDGQIAFAVNGLAPDADLAMRLSVIIPMGDERNTNDDLLTPPAAKAAGEKWPVNEKAMLASDLAHLFPGVDRIAGGVTLLKVLADDPSGPRGIVYGEYTLGDVHPPFPEGVDAQPSQVSFKVLATVPQTPGHGQYDLQLTAAVVHMGQTGNIRSGLSQTNVGFSINVEQTVTYKTGLSGQAPAVLAHAPAEPDAPPLAEGLSSAPFLRQERDKEKTISTAVGNPPDAVVPNGPNPSAPIPPVKPIPAAPTPAPPPIIFHSASSPFLNAQGIPAAPADTTKSN